MDTSQEKRIQTPPEEELEKSSMFSSMFNKFLYVPLQNTPAALIPNMLEQQYKREVEDKLDELKKAINDVAVHLRKQFELISMKLIERQDKVDQSLAAL